MERPSKLVAQIDSKDRLHASIVTAAKLAQISLAIAPPGIIKRFSRPFRNSGPFLTFARKAGYLK